MEHDVSHGAGIDVVVLIIIITILYLLYPLEITIMTRSSGKGELGES